MLSQKYYGPKKQVVANQSSMFDPNVTTGLSGISSRGTIELIVESYHIAIKSARDVAASSINRKNLNAFYIF